MNLKEVTYLLGWTHEKVELAIVDGVNTAKKQLVKLIAIKQGSDYDIKEEDVDTFLNALANSVGLNARESNLNLSLANPNAKW
ncbi:MAG: hypothetical protein ACLP2Y_15660 [Limisphaerales bacterium]